MKFKILKPVFADAEIVSILDACHARIDAQRKVIDELVNVLSVFVFALEGYLDAKKDLPMTGFASALETLKDCIAKAKELTQ